MEGCCCVLDAMRLAKLLIQAANSIGEADPEIGSTIRATGIASSDISEYFGPTKVTGIYLGRLNGVPKLYYNKKVYPINIDYKFDVIKEATPESRRKVASVLKSIELLRKRKTEDDKKADDEYAKNYEIIHKILTKAGFKPDKVRSDRVEAWYNIAGTNKKLMPILSDVNKSIIDIGYITNMRYGSILYNKPGNYPIVRLGRNDLKGDKIEITASMAIPEAKRLSV